MVTEGNEADVRRLNETATRLTGHRRPSRLCGSQTRNKSAEDAESKARRSRKKKNLKKKKKKKLKKKKKKKKAFECRTTATRRTVASPRLLPLPRPPPPLPYLSNIFLSNAELVTSRRVRRMNYRHSTFFHDSSDNQPESLVFV